MTMENDMYNAPLEDITHHLTQKPLIHCYSFDLNNQNHIINGIPILSSEQQILPSSNGQMDGCFMNQGNASNPIINSDFQDASLPARFGLQENFENSTTLSPSMEALGSHIFNNWHDTSTFGDNNVYEVPSNGKHGHALTEDSGFATNGKWNSVNKFPKASDIDGNSFMSYSSIGNLEPNGWESSTNVGNLANLGYSSSNCSNELSLSLATSPNTGQCSEISSSSNCSNMELSMCLGSHKHVKFSPAILGSRYLSGIQEILVQIAKYSFENLEEINQSSFGVRGGGNKSSSAFASMRRISMNHDSDSMSEVNVDSPLQRHASESKKSQLLMLLQMVDNQYSHCLDEIHTVVSAFHAATELDPHIHAHFALQTVSLLYKDLRERISNYILSMGSNFNSSWSAEEKECSVETSFIQKQWALQQLKRKDQLWRPQRGLPERSVSVLRDWMFQNFLHPYPKDAEKHLLAVKSGLTRSQVSNWFINARVRLWKPLIDEMYAEMNRRKACRNEGGKESSHRSMNNQMFNIN